MNNSSTALITQWQAFDLSDNAMHPSEPDHDLARVNDELRGLAAQRRIAWALENLPAHHVLSSSFGAQAAVAIHLLTKQAPEIPIIFIDTGYLFPETYQFVDELTAKLKLNLRVFRSAISPAWQEARHGKRWEAGSDGLSAYNHEAKVEPMKNALRTLEVGTWFVGLRRDQSPTRADVPFVQRSGKRFKVHPVADWSDRDVHKYLAAHHLPYHPLWHKGYVSIGDHHTTRPIHEVEHQQETRFFGVKRECGLHEFDFSSQ